MVSGAEQGRTNSNDQLHRDAPFRLPSSSSLTSTPPFVARPPWFSGGVGKSQSGSSDCSQVPARLHVKHGAIGEGHQAHTSVVHEVHKDLGTPSRALERRTEERFFKKGGEGGTPNWMSQKEWKRFTHCLEEPTAQRIERRLLSGSWSILGHTRPLRPSSVRIWVLI